MDNQISELEKELETVNADIEAKKARKKELEKASNLQELNEVFNKYLGKKGEVSGILSSLGTLPKIKRVAVGKAANDFKNFIEKEVEAKRYKIQNTGYKLS